MGKGLQRPASVMETLQRVLISVSGAVRYGALAQIFFYSGLLDPLKTLATGDAQQGIAGFKFSWLWRPCRFWVKAGRGDLTSADAGAVAVSGWGPLSLRLHRILRLHRLGLHRGIGLAVNSKPYAPVSALNSWGC